MGSVKFKDLKAYVRYDGNGRVVAGSLVFRKKKPKNGRWQEISSNLCCNPEPIPNPSTTTTTTTNGGGGGQGIPYQLYIGQDAFSACAFSQLIFLYFAVAPGENQVAYLDQALTIPYANGYINRFGDLYGTNMVGAMIYLGNCSQFTTTTTTTVSEVFYMADVYSCTDCNTPTQTGVIVKRFSNQPPLTNGGWYKNASDQSINYHITGSGFNTPGAPLVDAYNYYPSCPGCGGTTTTTTTQI